MPFGCSEVLHFRASARALHALVPQAFSLQARALQGRASCRPVPGPTLFAPHRDDGVRVERWILARASESGYMCQTASLHGPAVPSSAVPAPLQALALQVASDLAVPVARPCSSCSTIAASVPAAEVPAVAVAVPMPAACNC